MNYKIKFHWDSDAKVWIATCQDVPGLILESDSFDTLLERVRIAIPELLELNNKKQSEYNLIFETIRTDRVLAHG